MNLYIRNRNCRCARCRAHGMMGPAILITMGVLFLLQNCGIVYFHQSFPVVLLVIGAVLLVSRTGSTEGHIDPPVYTVAAPPVAYTGATPPPAANPQSWTSGATPAPSPTEPIDPQVNP